MTSRSHLLLLSVLALAGVFTFLKAPLASSQGVTLIAAQISGDLPVTDPGSDLWLTATAVEVPLSAQNVTRPMILVTRVKSVTARALHNNSQIAMLVEWADETQDVSVVRVQDFRDAVAVQFPLTEGQPFFCMGQQGGNVNLWHWKADWQADIAAREDMSALYPNMYVDSYPFTGAIEPAPVGPSDYTDPNYLPALASANLFASVTRASPVEDLIAGGFGSLTAQPAEGQNVQGFGGWADGKWRVVLSRDLASGEPEDVTFAPGKVYSMAFAVWDGSNGERNGQKSTSQWVSLQLGPAISPPAVAHPAPGLGGGAGFLFGLIPMVLVVLLGLGLAGTAILLSRLPDKK